MEPLVTAPPLVLACPQLWSLGWMSHPFRRVTRAFDRLAQSALKKFSPVHDLILRCSRIARLGRGLTQPELARG